MAPSSISESEDGVLSTDTPLSDDGDNSHRGSNGGIVLKKGPWTSAEDAILVDYVKKYGEGNWNAVQKHTGLLRCGKSCRLRWANHLRPNLKRGAFTPEEERLIIELHAKMGNKWARMAAHVSSNYHFFTSAQEFELPSLQYQETGLGVWNPAPKSLDCFVQSPLSGPLPSHCPPPGSSGLLQDVLYEAQALSKLENQSSAWTTTSSNVSRGDITDISALKTCSTEFKGCHDPSSPSGNSMGSIFNGCTPTDTIGSLLEEDMSELHMKSKLLYQSCILGGEQKETLNDLICSRPDAVLGSCWVEQSASQDSTTETIAALLGAELGTDMTTSASASMWGLNSCAWNNMPAVCQMSEIP
ncbi:hypothetical protein CDL12_14719 [Handroanthus impetiginosus]|uniref:Transcription factor, Myb superfamily n=1 Tax=Handroanthus impetiginosus TaxID=429701 RepID=A0A2G9H588_9LAMI|nr:hypothetical protein CDL12_14719 [Handroanthus impetiginosus]